MKENNQGVHFNSKIRKIGGSYYLLIKPELKNYLELREGSNITIQTEYKDEHGPYISAWNPSQQEGE